MRGVEFQFELVKETEQSAARLARVKTKHAEFETPIFMPVATHAAFRGQRIEDIAGLGFPIILSNTFHLFLRPGAEIFKKCGGIHRFMNWKRALLTDSGGFQIFSMAHALDTVEEGTRFRSYVDGCYHTLTPELSIETQRAIGSDIMMVLDQCVPSTVEHAIAEIAVERTARWAVRSFAARGDSTQALFGIVQGACYADLRARSAEQICAIPFDGFAIGGLAVGEERSQREDFTQMTAALLPRDKPRYLMGVGTPIDLLEAVHRGVDMFDCVLPTAFAQQGVVFTSRGKIDLRRGVYRGSEAPLDDQCTCETCRHYTRGYLHHLIKVGEYSGSQLLGIHNLSFYYELMREIRESIKQDRFITLYRAKREWLALADEQNPPKPPRRRSAVKEHRGDYQIVENRQGFFSVMQRSSGETMHASVAPGVEARSLYVEQMRILDRVQAVTVQPVVVWDVGLGAAINAMALISDYESLAQRVACAPLRLISFERDLDPLQLTLKFAGKFPHAKHPAPHQLLKNGSWSDRSGRISWQLLVGDVREKLSEASPADYIFFDPFSYKTDSDLWGQSFLGSIAQRCQGRPTLLATYSASTAFRAALLCAGFYVGKGVATGAKEQTTLAALPPIPHWFPSLGESWLLHWERSGNRYPIDASEVERQKIENTIRNHPQFMASFANVV